ncbi:uncharacterized protein LOC126735967 [Anthonomus grandis grandis]|uniref:uncharacterized protein LOC126735967 n=1 Tax=Anthonomus grandis grandis TaxID=2921223 RepID=UPI0021661B50|nr:uncharacterized protein LOC126735967 [Anthonomus grandis grandis]
MSCRGRGRCGGAPGNLPQASFAASTPAVGGASHRTIHLSMDRGQTSPIEQLGASFNEQYSGYGAMRIPPAAARASTPGPYGYPSQYDTFGSQIDYNLSWMPKDINLSELLDQTASQMSSRYRRMEQNITHTPTNLNVSETPSNANPLLSQEQSRDQAAAQSKKTDGVREESLLEWFDRSVEKELKKHKSSSIGKEAAPANIALSLLDENDLLNMSKGVMERVSEATASQVEIVFDLRKEPDTELTDAVDKYAKAEAMCAFAGAVKAAEAAAYAAPPELVEEAALASARGFETDVKATGVHGELEGVRPIEVVGYVGVTKPKYPTKRQ